MTGNLKAGITIRPFRMADHEAAWRLWEKELPHSHDSSWNYRMTQRFLRHNPDLCFSAFAGETLIGTVMGSFDGRRGYVQHLAVDAAWRGERIGTALMDTLMQKMEERDIRKVHLMVKTDNRTVREFYEKADWAGRDDILLMSIRLREEDAPAQ